MRNSIGTCVVVAAVAIAGLGGCTWAVPYKLDPTIRSGEPESGLEVDFAGTTVRGDAMSWLVGRMVVRNVSPRVIAWDPNAPTVVGEGCNPRTRTFRVVRKGAGQATLVSGRIEFMPGESCVVHFETLGLGACGRVQRRGHSVPERLFVDLGEAAVGGKVVRVGRFGLRPVE